MLRTHALAFLVSLAFLAACAGQRPVADTATETVANDPSVCRNDHEHDDHTHQAKCGHKSVKHDGHLDYHHDGHMDCPHNGHYDVREPASAPVSADASSGK